MKSFVKVGVSTYFVSPPGFGAVEEINHRPDNIIPVTGELGLLGYLLSLLYHLLIIRPDRFVPFNIFGGFIGGIVSIFTNTQTVLFVRGDFYRGRAINGGLRTKIIKEFITCIEWVTFRFVDHIVFISEHNRLMMVQRTQLDESKTETTVLYNNILTQRVSKQLNSTGKPLEGSPAIGFAGEFPSGGEKVSQIWLMWSHSSKTHTLIYICIY